MKIICLASLLCTALTLAWSEQLSYNMYGQPGLIDMPTAQSDSDGVLALNQSYFDGTLRTTITAQILPRLSASFRYAGHGKNGSAALDYSNWDRSFDLRFRLRDEGKYLPALAVGLNDFIGTGKYSGEYLVATKLLGDLSLSAGLEAVRLTAQADFDAKKLQAEATFLLQSREQEGIAQGYAAIAKSLRENPEAIVALEGLKAQAKIAASLGQSQNALIVPSETAGLFGAIASLAKGYEAIKPATKPTEIGNRVEKPET